MDEQELEVEVMVKGVSDLLKPSSSHALILEEVNCDRRCLAVIIGDREAKDIRMAMARYKTPRPLTVELMLDIMNEGGITVNKAVIYKVKDGIYYSYIYLARKNDGYEFKVDSRTTDALVLSLKAGFPVYVYDSILANERLYSVTPDGSGFSLSLNAVGTELLKTNLEAAIKNEDYEKAAQLRDEIARREKGCEE